MTDNDKPDKLPDALAGAPPNPERRRLLGGIALAGAAPPGDLTAALQFD